MADFSTYGYIKNSTSSTIKITNFHATHGSWSKQPTPTTIKPGDVCSFAQKDPTGAAVTRVSSLDKNTFVFRHPKVS
ncbi:hypothetical protein [Pseudoalteromonas luteoviolacea]|uniref:Uncharacterized protein n=1 Tax=Pseudoalteromonas luteoviolacea (strain 2ta16) TaxID=1353533 RepID=V4I4B2_PSEL2|nr:hypothetical protein [Pseudoalteromonas luteoviolacea]ESP95084.1 hypothetical protein PL2TA16_04640 [Pseudoalteromonas luteoviolacea 2ta16]KZN41211.1 hypothetical protein N483_16500 [Pseudoalteromonas luteoviolacea NCIMB 1944]